MSLIPGISTLFAALLLIACTDLAIAGSIPIRTLAKGAFSQIQTRSELVIKDEARWKEVWEKHSGAGGSAKTMPDVDFSKEMVLVVAMGRQTTGGYGVEVVKAESSGDALKVYVVRKTPRPGGMSLQALTAPFHIVALPKSDLKVTFIDQPPKQP